jgi:hypothetical protein
MLRKKIFSCLLSALLFAALLPTTVFQADAATTNLGTAKILDLYYYTDEQLAVCHVSQGPDDVNYEFQASDSSDFDPSSTKTKIVSYQSDGYELDVSEVPTGMTGYVRVRYTKTVNGETQVGAWSNVKSKTSASASGITASNITKSSSSQKQSFSVNAKASGASSLKYSSDNDSIKVSSTGTVTVAANYVGSAKITITIVDSKGQETNSKRITVKINKATTPVSLSTPSLESATNTSTGVRVTWSKVKNAEGYGLYRKNSKGNWKLIQRIKNGSTTTAVDTDVKNGTKYTYTVRAYNKSSGEAVFSSYKKAGISTYRLSSPTHVSLKNSASKKVTVKWKKNSAATGYQIQYSYSSSFSSKKQIIVKKASTVSTTISKLTKNKKVYVRVRAYKTVSGKHYYSAWNGVHYITVKK